MLRKISPIFQTVTNRRPPTPKGKVFRHFPLLFFKYFPHQNGHCADAAEIYLRAVAFFIIFDEFDVCGQHSTRMCLSIKILDDFRNHCLTIFAVRLQPRAEIAGARS